MIKLYWDNFFWEVHFTNSVTEFLIENELDGCVKKSKLEKDDFYDISKIGLVEFGDYALRIMVAQTDSEGWDNAVKLFILWSQIRYVKRGPQTIKMENVRVEID